jgi:hypothetical protein
MIKQFFALIFTSAILAQDAQLEQLIQQGITMFPGERVRISLAGTNLAAI